MNSPGQVQQDLAVAGMPPADLSAWFSPSR
jgi:hypothetical protein